MSEDLETRLSKLENRFDNLLRIMKEAGRFKTEEGVVGLRLSRREQEILIEVRSKGEMTYDGHSSHQIRALAAFGLVTFDHAREWRTHRAKGRHQRYLVQVFIVRPAGWPEA